jgi:cytochrome P450
MEMALALATLARAGRPVLESGAMPRPEPRLTLRLKGPVMMRVARPEAVATG